TIYPTRPQTAIVRQQGVKTEVQSLFSAFINSSARVLTSIQYNKATMKNVGIIKTPMKSEEFFIIGTLVVPFVLFFLQICVLCTNPVRRLMFPSLFCTPSELLQDRLRLRRQRRFDQ
ncbi:hypothetical protein BOX15_Mlig003279g4, partial [Macrostomum lignano]